MDRLEQWLIDHPLVGFILLAMTGGAVAHIRNYEKAGVELTSGQHFWGILRRALSSGFTGLLVYFGWRAMGWSEMWGYFTAGMIGLFATEATEALFLIGREWLRTKFLGPNHKSPDQLR